MEQITRLWLDTCHQLSQTFRGQYLQSLDTHGRLGIIEKFHPVFLSAGALGNRVLRLFRVSFDSLTLPAEPVLLTFMQYSIALCSRLGYGTKMVELLVR